MNAPFKVLLFSICIVLGLVILVLFKFNLLRLKSTATPPPSETSQAVAVAKPSVTDESKLNLENGKKLYSVKTCELCHGANGKGNTSMGKAVGATDLTLDTFKKNTKNLPRMEYILQVIEEGVPGTGMVSFKAQIPSEQDRRDLAGYVNSLDK